MGTGKVRVRFLGLVRNTVGLAEEEVEVPTGASLGDLLAVLADRHGQAFRNSVLRVDGGLRPAARVLIDDRDIEQRAGLDTKLAGQEITVMVEVFPIQGG